MVYSSSMDELLLSGKKHISARRAGKENGYASDYIGQLIRAQKLKGQKVGRAWYVEEESLKHYLINPREGKMTEPQAQKEKLQAPTSTPAPLAPALQKTSAPAPVFVEKEKPRSPILHVMPLLTYLKDGEELIPSLAREERKVEIRKSKEESDELTSAFVATRAPLPMIRSMVPGYTLAIPTLMALLFLGFTVFSERIISYDAKTGTAAASMAFTNPFK